MTGEATEASEGLRSVMQKQLVVPQSLTWEQISSWNFRFLRKDRAGLEVKGSGSTLLLGRADLPLFISL